MQELHVKSLLPVRLDKYLMEQFPALGLGRLNKALRENKIKLNGKKQPLATRVQNGDVIRVYLLDDQLGLTSQEGPEFLQARARTAKVRLKRRCCAARRSLTVIFWINLPAAWFPTDCRTTIICI